MKQHIHRTTIEFHFAYDPASPNSLMNAMTKAADVLEDVKKRQGVVVTKNKSGLHAILADTPK